MGAATALLLASAACRSDAPQAPALSAAAKDTAAAGGNLLARLDAARPTACSADAQCHTIGVGAKACGGPERYLAWSSRDDDGTRLRALVAEHAAARRAEDSKAGMMSTCSVVPDPGAACVAGQCVPQSAAPGAGGVLAR
jgi:hypothetical protein